jgi:FixJ family two-component response regulator
MIVLIDDDELMQRTWKYKAEQAGVSIMTVDSVETFYSIAGSLDKSETTIYIDENLGSEKGSVVSKQIYDLGFKTIYITTGETDLRKPDWIIDVISKRPPF